MAYDSIRMGVEANLPSSRHIDIEELDEIRTFKQLGKVAYLLPPEVVGRIARNIAAEMQKVTIITVPKRGKGTGLFDTPASRE